MATNVSIMLRLHSLVLYRSTVSLILMSISNPHGTSNSSTVISAAEAFFYVRLIASATSTSSNLGGSLYDRHLRSA